MPPRSKPLRKLGFLPIGLFDEANPGAGHESTLQIIELGEQLGFDGTLVHHLQLQFGGQRRMNFLTSSVVGVPDQVAPVDFTAIQTSLIHEFRAHYPGGPHARVSQGLVVLPVDSATPEQRAKYEACAAARLPRVGKIHARARARTSFAEDLVGTCDVPILRST